MRAFARYDGLRLFLLWLLSFILYVAGFKTPFLGVLAMILAFMTPFRSSRKLRYYRDEVLGGTISFRRAWVYVVFQFFYASLLFALAQFIYFSYIDKGYFMSQMAQMFSDPATAKALQQMGMGQALSQTLTDLSQMRPIDLVLNIMTSNLLVGLVVGLPIGFMAHRSGKPLPPTPPQEENING